MPTNLLSDPSFERASVATFDGASPDLDVLAWFGAPASMPAPYAPSGSAWSFSPANSPGTTGCGIAHTGSIVTSPAEPLPDGAQCAWFYGGGAVAQDVAGLLDGAYAVRLRFRQVPLCANFTPGAPHPLNYPCGGPPANIHSNLHLQILVDGTVVGEVGGQQYDDWGALQSDPIVLAAGTHQVTIAQPPQTIYALVLVDSVELLLLPRGVRLTDPAGQTQISHDGTSFKVYSGGTPVLAAPFFPGGGTPIVLLAIDPDSGLPATYAISGVAPPVTGLPSGILGDMLWHGPAGWEALPTTGDGTYVLGQTTVDTTVEPLWVPAPSTGPSVPPDTQIMCGMAHYLSDRVCDAYNWLVQQWRDACALYQASLAAGLSLASDVLLAFVGEAAVLLAAIAELDVVESGVEMAKKAASLSLLTPGQKDDGVTGSIYCALRATTGTGTMIAGTLDAIRAEMDAYPNWFVTPDGQRNQLAVLGIVLNTFTLTDWNRWAHRGSLEPQATCVGWCDG